MNDFQISNDQAIKQLRKIGERIISARDRVKRKKTWSPSEKAMTVCDYEYDLSAIRMAIALFEKEAGRVEMAKA